MADVVTFDASGPLRIVEISTGADNTLDWQEIYSEWKAWTQTGDNMKYPPAFAVVGGDPISETETLGSAFFILAPWKLRPAEHDHRLTINGDVFTVPAGESPIVPTLGGYTCVVELKVSSLPQASAYELLDGIRMDTTSMLKYARNRLRVNLATQELELYDDDGSTLIQRWALSTWAGENVSTITGAQTERGAPLL